MSRSTTPYSTTNLNRKKSQSQPAVKRAPSVSLYESVRTFLWKNPLKRNGRGKVRNPHKADEVSNKISTGIHKRTKSTEMLDQLDADEVKGFSEDDEDENEPELKEVEMDDGEEDWDKEMELQKQEEAKSNRKRAKRRLSGGNLLDTESSDQVDDVDMDQHYNFIFTQKCQIESSKPPAKSGSNLLLFQQNDLSKSVNFESLGGFKGHHTTSFLI